MKINFDLNKLGPTQRHSWRIVYHEIGHVIAHIHCDLPFDYVTIVRDGRTAGHVKVSNLDEANLSAQDLEKCTIILLAGEAIDRRLFGRHEWYSCSARLDFQELNRLHKRKSELPWVIPNEDGTANYFFLASRKVVRILDQSEKEIHVLAHELKRRKTLTSDEVREILGKVDQVQVDFKAAAYRGKRNRRLLQDGVGLPFL